MTDWLFPRDPIPGVGTAPFDAEAKPTWKLLLHTTEGSSYPGARSSYVKNKFAPHVTCGADSNGAFLVMQHLPLSSRATTLSDDSGGIRPNRDYVIQVEIIGFCDPRWKNHELYIHNWSKTYAEHVAYVLKVLLKARPIPKRSTVTWVEYPKSYGERASQRLAPTAFDLYAGILGHQHAPENDHGDPGNLSAFVRQYLIPKPTARRVDVTLKGPPMAIEPAQLVTCLDSRGIFAVDFSGASHVKNPTHRKWLTDQGWVTTDVKTIPKAELDALLEKEVG